MIETIRKLIKIYLFGIVFFSVTLYADYPATVEIEKKHFDNIEDKLPATLSGMSVPHPTVNINTPEYVIIRSKEIVNFTSETYGNVLTLPLEEGSAFKKGDILLTLDCRLQEADLQKSLAQQQAAQKAYESTNKLKDYGSISDFEVIKAKSEADAANADVSKLKVIIEKCTIKAPFNGSVAEMKTHLHETVKPGDPLLKIVNTDNLIFEIQVPSKWLSWLQVGSLFTVYINDINKKISAKVTYINPEIEPISQTVRITSTIEPPDAELKPGMTGQANFPEHR